MKNICLVLLAFILTSFILTGCSSVSPLQLPKVENLKNVSKLNPNQVDSSITLAKLVNDIDRGTEVISFPNSGSYNGQDSAYCNLRGGTKYTWVGGRNLLGDWSSQYGKDFYETMSKNGYKVAGNSEELFFQQEAANSAEFVIGGRLVDLKGNYCHLHHWWDGRPLNQFSGETYTKIEWSVLNSLTKEVVLKTITEGYGLQPTPIVDGVYSSLSESLIVATEALAQNETLKKLVMNKQIKKNDNQINTPNIKILNSKSLVSSEAQKSSVFKLRKLHIET